MNRSPVCSGAELPVIVLGAERNTSLPMMGLVMKHIFVLICRKYMGLQDAFYGLSAGTCSCSSQCSSSNRLLFIHIQHVPVPVIHSISTFLRNILCPTHQLISTMFLDKLHSFTTGRCCCCCWGFICLRPPLKPLMLPKIYAPSVTINRCECT